MTGPSPWTVSQSQPVVAPGSLHPEHDSSRAGAAHVLRLGDRYRMVYWGTDGEGRHHILQAETSVDEPNAWRPLGAPLIGPQPDTEHNCAGPGFPFLLPVTADHWLLYFTGWGRRADGKLPNTTGVAISDDGGRSWRYHTQHPVLPLDRPYDAEGTGSLWVLHEDGRFRMYYTAIGSYCAKPDGIDTGHGDTLPQIGIAYAESSDGIHWEKPFNHLVVTPRGFGVVPYEYICSKPCVLQRGGTYTLWVNTFGTAYRVHRLTSADGLAWQWADRLGPDGELGVGAPHAFDDHQRCYPTITCDRDTLHCWFTGNGFGAAGMGYAVGTRASAESHRYFQELHETPAFGASGQFDLDELREIMGARREPTDPAVQCRPWQADDLRGEWVLAPDADPDLRLLYLHGGGFVSGSGAYYLAMAAHISAAAGCAVLLLDYRLAPEHPFPAAIEDCIRAHEWLLASGPDGPAPARATFLAGDSAGGGLTLAALLALRDRQRRLPQAGVPISAFADMTLTGESLRTEEAFDPIMSPRCPPQFVGLYLGDADPRDRLASPILADYSGLPPLLFQVGEHEIIRDDSVTAAARARADGVDTTLEVWPGMFHVFPSHEPLLPEGRRAIEHIAAFLQRCAAHS